MIASSQTSSRPHRRPPQATEPTCDKTSGKRPVSRLAGWSICILTLAVLAPQARAIVPAQVDDLRNTPGPWGRFVYPPAEYVVIGNIAFFFADDGISGVELWRTDGTAAGTHMVRDIHPGAAGSLPTGLTNLNGTLLFAADDGTCGVELWKSDGTTAGTVMVKDIRPGPENSWPGGLAVAGSLRLAPAGLAPGLAQPGGAGPANNGGTALRSRVIRRARLFFRADDGIHGSELWVSDGTEAGTEMLSDILPGPDASAPQDLTDFRGRLFFAAYTDATGVELWKSNGTAAGTQLVADIVPGPMGSAIGQLTRAGGLLFFTAVDGVHGQELWKSDGTTAGTQLVKDINDEPISGTNNTLPSSPSWLTNVNGTLFFAAEEPDQLVDIGDFTFVHVGGRELWKSDGTETGTVRIKDLAISLHNPQSSNPTLLTKVGDSVFFTAVGIDHDLQHNNESLSPFELWKSDGTEAGTVPVADICPGNACSASIREMTNVHGTAFFAAMNQTSGLELWKSDGTAAGTALVADIRPGDMAGSAPRSLTDFNGTLLFEATTSGTNRQLWRSDGTQAGTALVADIQPQPGSAVPNSLADVNGTLFFTADDGLNGAELWRTDGTQAGTSLVDDLSPGIFGSVPRFLTTAGGTLFFTADQLSPSGEELWKLDPTSGLPVLVRDIRTLPDVGFSSSPEFLTDFGGTLYFKAFLGGQLDTSTTGGHQLWKSDGTTAGTALVADIWPNTSTSPSELSTVAGTLFMAADDEINGEELWKSDGTLAGTVMVADIQPGPDGAEPEELTGAGSILFFAADDGSGGGRELWRSDGTAAGTTLVKDIRPGPISSNPRHMAAVGGVLFFTANDGIHGDELWISDGTAAGTVMVADLVPGPLSSLPSFIVDAGPAFGAVFAAYDANVGVELWQSDGTAAGTMPLTDIAPGILSANPRFMTVSGGRLYFTANDHANGWELWTFPLQ